MSSSSPDTPHALPAERTQGRALEVFLAFLRLGLTSFGGPVAHLGYFRAEFVERRRWLDERRYADLLGLCQFLPGPSSSQLGMALGLLRAGWSGALAAWLGFTAPSALLMIAFGYGMAAAGALAQGGLVHGLKVAAVAVVAQAVWGMARTLCPDRPRAGIGLCAALLVLVLPTSLAQLGAIAASAIAGVLLVAAPAAMAEDPHAAPLSRRAGVLAWIVFAALLVALPLVAQATGSSLLHLLDGVYRAGALVVGGGHVVLPLLQAAVVPAGAVTNEQFLAGYGAAQAVPGPLFTFAAYLGTVMDGPFGGWQGGLAFLVAIFLPGFLLLAGALPLWEPLRHRAGVRAAMAGVNAGVVGILLAALYDPVWTSAIHSRADFALGVAAFGLLVVARFPPPLVVLLAAAAGWALG